MKRGKNKKFLGLFCVILFFCIAYIFVPNKASAISFFESHGGKIFPYGLPINTGGGASGASGGGASGASGAGGGGASGAGDGGGGIGISMCFGGEPAFNILTPKKTIECPFGITPITIRHKYFTTYGLPTSHGMPSFGVPGYKIRNSFSSISLI